MQEVTPIGGDGGQPTVPGTNGPQTSTDAFGVAFEDLLQIVLTQLTYQDPLQPLENAEFVSQLAQFSQIQQTETGNERLQAILDAGLTSQAASFLGRNIDIEGGATVITGRVISVSLVDGVQRFTIETPDGRTIGNISTSAISRLALAE